MPVSRIMAVILLLITLSLGVLLAQVTGERNAVKAKLEGKTEQLDDAKSERDELKFRATRCEAALNQQNIDLSNTQQQSIVESGKANERADQVLASLPDKIAKDRLANTVASANKWMVELFK